jgi:hypothetical protein
MLAAICGRKTPFVEEKVRSNKREKRGKNGMIASS